MKTPLSDRIEELAHRIRWFPEEAAIDALELADEVRDMEGLIATHRRRRRRSAMAWWRKNLKAAKPKSWWPPTGGMGQ